jgi:hypothetical protein
MKLDEKYFEEMLNVIGKCSSVNMPRFRSINILKQIALDARREALTDAELAVEKLLELYQQDEMFANADGCVEALAAILSLEVK